MITQNIEDLKIYFYDMFNSTEQIEEKTTAEAYNIWEIGEITMSSGIPTGGYSMIYYNKAIFNPKYADVIFKLRLTSSKDIKAFFGFRTNITEPDINMTESHIGVLIWNVGGKTRVYLSSGNGSNQQKTEISGLDLTETYEFMLSEYGLYIRPTPKTLIIHGIPTDISVDRTWKQYTRNTTITPINTKHYLTIYIGNLTNAEKILYLNKIIYKEKYAD